MNIKINARKVFYWQKNSAKKRTVILLHGFPGNHLGLTDLAKSLGRDYRIIIPDLPASGGSDIMREKHILKNYAEWLNDFLKELSIEKAVIIGHSFGARVALYFGAAYPEKTERIVLITPILKLDGVLVNVASLRYKIAKLLPVSMQKTYLSSKFYEYLCNAVISKSRDLKKRQRITSKNIKELKHLNAKVHIELFNEFYKLNLIPLGGRIKSKALLIAGDKDKVATLQSINELAGKMNDVSLKIVKGAGHLLPLESPTIVSNLIRGWLKSNY